MTDKRPDTGDIDRYFLAARRNAPEPGSDLMARILGDAAALQPRGFVPATGASSIRTLLEALGGWPGLGGLAAAAAAGIWLGFAAPAPLGDSLVTIFAASEALPLWPDDLLDAVAAADEG